MPLLACAVEEPTLPLVMPRSARPSIVAALPMPEYCLPTCRRSLESHDVTPVSPYSAPCWASKVDDGSDTFFSATSSRPSATTAL